MFKWIKKAGKSIHSYMESVAEENTKQYGNKKLDCCDINKNK